MLDGLLITLEQYIKERILYVSNNAHLLGNGQVLESHTKDIDQSIVERIIQHFKISTNKGKYTNVDNLTLDKEGKDVLLILKPLFMPIKENHDHRLQIRNKHQNYAKSSTEDNFVEKYSAHRQLWKYCRGTLKLIQLIVEMLNPDSLIDYLGLIYPPLLQILDDYDTQNIQIGLYSLQKLCFKVPASKLKWAGVGDALMETVKRSLTYSEHDMVQEATPTFVALVKVLYIKGSMPYISCLEWGLTQSLKMINTVDKIKILQMLTDHVVLYVDILGLISIRHLRMILLALEIPCKSMDLKTQIIAINAINKISFHLAERFSKHQGQLLKLLSYVWLNYQQCKRKGSNNQNIEALSKSLIASIDRYKEILLNNMTTDSQFGTTAREDAYLNPSAILQNNLDALIEFDADIFAPLRDIFYKSDFK